MQKVMFVCSAGMSTSLLVEKVIKAAEEKAVDIEVYAVGEAEARKDLSQADILLLGPQVRYLENSFKKAIGDSKTKLGVVDMLAYGRMDGEKVLGQILELSQQ
ncbi:MAG: PTS sugar transporter subunit IIB [Oscillospiraceae bacterium]|nr:PTS sugar transporter subunit IIB [Oscillospiraceae bacterium]